MPVLGVFVVAVVGVVVVPCDDVSDGFTGVGSCWAEDRNLVWNRDDDADEGGGRIDRGGLYVNPRESLCSRKMPCMEDPIMVVPFVRGSVHVSSVAAQSVLMRHDAVAVKLIASV
jgi:hypothetical protein